MAKPKKTFPKKFQWETGEAVQIELMQCHSCKYLGDNFSCQVFERVPHSVRDKDIICTRHSEKQ